MDLTQEYSIDVDLTSLNAVFNDGLRGYLREILHCSSEAWERDYYPAFVAAYTGKERFSTFIANTLVKNFQVKLTNDQKHYVGENFKVKQGSIRCLLTPGCAGAAEDYYHKGSCYWTVYAQSRDWIEGNGGGSVRFYDKKGIIGRAWYVPYSGTNLKDGIILFNVYGSESYDLNHSLTYAQYTARALGQDYHAISFNPNINSEDYFYLNNNSAYFVGSVEKRSERRFEISYKFTRPETFRYAKARIRCQKCSNHVAIDNAINMHDYNSDYAEDYTVCRDCFDYYFCNSALSGILYDKNDCIKIKGSYYHRTIDCVVDVYRNYYPKTQDGVAFFTCMVDGKVYPMSEGIKVSAFGTMNKKYSDNPSKVSDEKSDREVLKELFKQLKISQSINW